MQTMHLLPGVAIQPNLELKTRPKPVLGSLPLAFALPGTVDLIIKLLYFIEYSVHFFTLKMMLKYSLRTIHGR